MTKIDITKPLELSDGTPCRYVGESNVADAKYHVRFYSGFRDGWHRHFKADGSHVWDELPSLRNVKESEVRTGLECVERMEALLRRMASERGGNYATPLYAEAREIVAELKARRNAISEQNDRMLYGD